MNELFPQRLREVREASKLSQMDFAEKIGISRASLSYYENGTRTPDVYVLRSLHQVTGVSIYYLLGLSDMKDDSLNQAQKDTGLSEEALSRLAADPFSQKVIDLLLHCNALESITRNIAVLYDDAIYMPGNPPEDWTPTMKKLREIAIKNHQTRLSDMITSAVQEFARLPGAVSFGTHLAELPSNMPMRIVQQLKSKYLQSDPSKSEDEITVPESELQFMAAIMGALDEVMKKNGKKTTE